MGLFWHGPARGDPLTIRFTYRGHVFSLSLSSEALARYLARTRRATRYATAPRARDIKATLLRARERERTPDSDEIVSAIIKTHGERASGARAGRL